MPPTELSRRRGWARVYRAIFLLLIVSACISAGVGAWNGAHRSQDLQWSGAHLLWQHVDPWAVYLQGDSGHRFIQSQVPNYLAILYLIMLPLGCMPLLAAKVIWVLCNLTFAIASGVLAGRFFGIRGRGLVTVVCFLLMATPTRTTIGNGQQGLFVLLFWCLGLLPYRMESRHAAFAGIAYAKFSFAPPVVLFLLLRRGWRAALWSLVPAASALLLAWLWVTGGRDVSALLRIAIEPFQTARIGFPLEAGDQNLMALLEPFLHGVSQNVRDGVELAAAFSICAAVSFAAYSRSNSVRWQLALMATMSYGLFKHHPYDGVVLLLPLCYAIRLWHQRSAKVMIGLIAYFFYLQRGLEALHWHPGWAHHLEFGMLMTLLALNFRLREGASERALVRTLWQKRALVA